MELEKNIPIPVKVRKKKRSKYDTLLSAMTITTDDVVGDSIFFAISFSAAHAACRQFNFRTNLNYKFKIVKLNENGKDGVRIWRTA